MTRSTEIEIDMIETYDPESSPLDYLFQDPDYRRQDEARLAAWHNDEWHFVGIRARATTNIPYGARSTLQRCGPEQRSDQRDQTSA
jgi:hypothetical protein